MKKKGGFVSPRREARAEEAHSVLLQDYPSPRGRPQKSADHHDDGADWPGHAYEPPRFSY